MNAAHIVSPLLVGLADLLESGQGHALISACPGAGKTHTLTKIAQRHSNYKILALVFNRHNAQELRTRLPQSCEVKTIHSLAVGLLYKGGLRYTPCASVGASCYREMRELLETSLLTRVSPAAYKAMLSELAARYDAYLLSALAFEHECPKFDSPAAVATSPLADPQKTPQEATTPVPDKGVPNYATLLPMLLERRTQAVEAQRSKKSEQSEQATQSEFKLAFNETLHYACRQLEAGARRREKRAKGAKTSPGATGSSLILLDELQDSSPLALRLVTLSLGTQGRLIAVGDPRQNIMGFAGAAQNPYGLLEALLGEQKENGTAVAQKSEDSGNARKKSNKAKPSKTGQTGRANPVNTSTHTTPRPTVSHFGLEQSRRVPQRHAVLANYVFNRYGVARYPDFIGTDQPGVLCRAELESLPRLLEEGDRVLSRTAMPLVHLALALLEFRFSLEGARRQNELSTAHYLPRLRLGGSAAELRRLQGEVFKLFDASDSGEYAQNHSPLERMQRAITGVTRPKGFTPPPVTPTQRDTPEDHATPCVATPDPAIPGRRVTGQPVPGHQGDPEGPLELAKALFEGLLDLSGNPEDSARLKAVLRGALEDLLSPAQGILLSTIHGAKGSEACRVFVLGPALLPRTAFDPAEEERLRFVAFTRSLETLVLVPLESEDLAAIVPPGLTFDPLPTVKAKPMAWTTPFREIPQATPLFTEQPPTPGPIWTPAYPPEVRNSSEVPRPARSIAPAPSSLCRGSLQKAYLDAKNGLKASISELEKLQDTLKTLVTQGRQGREDDFIARHLERRSAVLRAQQEKYRQKCALFERELEHEQVG